MAACAGLLLPARKSRATAASDPLAGEFLRTLLEKYDALGEHRTAGPGDEATSQWLAQRFSRLGFKVDLPGFEFDLFEPAQCALSLVERGIETFPAWPVVETGDDGISAQLAVHDAPDVAGKIAVIALPYKPYATWAQPMYGEPVQAAIARGARAVVAITEGPTGGIIALNALPSRYGWTVPVVLAPGREKDTLLDAATRGADARLVSIGHLAPGARATNVMARRAGTGKTIVLSTPKSGWFHCANERGSGIAIFLGLAQWLADKSDADILCIATSGHEIDGTGGRRFLTSDAPKPDQVRLWLHIGANIACNSITFVNGVPARTSKINPKRRIIASASLLDATHAAFKGQSGYDTPVDAASTEAVGEAFIFRDAGYTPIVSLVGGSPLFHTGLDRASLAAKPNALEPVARSLASLLDGVLHRA